MSVPSQVNCAVLLQVYYAELAQVNHAVAQQVYSDLVSVGCATVAVLELIRDVRSMHVVAFWSRHRR
jgi:hypothetical protein